MPIRALLRYLMNNEQLIQKLADSHPIRRAAQLTAYFIHKGKEIGEDKLERIRESDAVNRMQDEAKRSASHIQDKAHRSVEKTNKFLGSFFTNLQDEWKKAEKKLEEQRRLDAESKRREKDR